MPDLLIISRTIEDAYAIESVAAAEGFRVKLTHEYAVAIEWLQLREYAVVLIEATFPVTVQQNVAHELWMKNPEAPLVAFSQNEGDEKNRVSRLLGAEFIQGPTFLEQIARFLKSQKSVLPQKLSDFTVMVVEDLDAPRDIICAYIEHLGFPAVKGFRSAQSAMEALLSPGETFSCVITDMKMPEISGKQLLEFVRASKSLRHLPVVMLTAHGTADLLIDCLKAGASGFLVKPPKKNDLLRELSRALRISSGLVSPRLASDQEAEAVRALLLANSNFSDA